jgi:nucleotide-binding universal stress UspA family protein
MEPNKRRGVFKHVLIATDGSPLSNKAARAGIALAKALGAKVTAYYAVDELQPLYLEGYAMAQAMLDDLDARAKALGEKRVAAIAKMAKEAGVRFNALVRKANTAYEGIIDAAKRQRCDVIFMASHGRRGLSRLMMGSVTQKVLMHSKIPVVVYR